MGVAERSDAEGRETPNVLKFASGNLYGNPQRSQVRVGEPLLREPPLLTMFATGNPYYGTNVIWGSAHPLFPHTPLNPPTIFFKIEGAIGKRTGMRGHPKTGIEFSEVCADLRFYQNKRAAV